MTPASVLRGVTHPFSTLRTTLLGGPRTMPPQPGGAPATSDTSNVRSFFAPQAANSNTQGPAAAAQTPATSPAAAPAATGTGSSGAATGTTNNTSQNISNASNSLASDQTTFLKLLTTQLQNQDPLSPMDTNAFTQQLVAMTGVQQQILSNQLLQQMVGQQGGIGNSVGLIGKDVKVATGASTLQGGNATWNYNLTAGASDVTFTVIDAQGNTVWSGDQSALSAGDHTFSWDGKDLAGVQRADGTTFGLKVNATAADGSAISSTTWLQGTVSSIQQINGETIALVNGTQVPLSLISSVNAT
jgi:flagellar basal-body rod modification protein FlgD